MARYRRHEIHATLIEDGLLALFFHADAAKALTAARAVRDSGLRLVEFTHRGREAPSVFDRLVREMPELRVGVGSVVDAPTAAHYINAGACFVVGPGFNGEVARLCNRRKVPYLPGCATLTEIGNAEEAGCETLKIFPAMECGGPGFIKAVLGPSPWSTLMPTGGVRVDEEALREWFRAGAACVGLGSDLLTPALLEAGDGPALRRRCELARELVARAREEKP